LGDEMKVSAVIPKSPRFSLVGAHRLRPTSESIKPKNFRWLWQTPPSFMDSMNSVGGAQAMRPYPWNFHDFIARIEKFEHRLPPTF
jgi:hypothetical protein